jgi:hypothetical protein
MIKKISHRGMWVEKLLKKCLLTALAISILGKKKEKLT